MTPIPTVILTRPKPASDRVAAALGDIPSLIAPVTEIVGTGQTVDTSRYRGVILTSANAIPFLPDLSGVPVYCVGQRTAEASHGDVRLIATDADDLVSRLSVPGPLVHARGRETRGNIAERLNLAGIETDSVEIYRQDPAKLPDRARRLIEGDAPAVLPLWSPRSAERLAAQISRIGPNLVVIALSPSVAEAWNKRTGGTSEVCDTPDGAEMIARIVAASRR